MHHCCFQLKEVWNHKRGKAAERKWADALFFFSFSQLCCAVQRKESDGVRKGKWGLLGQKVEKSENNEGRKHFALDFVRRSQSFPSISASCLPRFSSTDRNTHTHTHKTLKMNINTRLAHSDPQLTQSKCENIKKRETKRSNLPFQLFLAVYTQAWQIVCANCRWKETAVEMLSPLLSQCLSYVVSFKPPDICSNIFAPCRFLRSCSHKHFSATIYECNVAYSHITHQMHACWGWIL